MVLQTSGSLTNSDANVPFDSDKLQKFYEILDTTKGASMV